MIEKTLPFAEPVLLVILVGWIISLLTRPDSQVISDVNNWKVLRYGVRMRLFAWLLAILIIGFSVAASGVLSNKSADDWPASLLIVLLAIVFLIEVLFVRIEFDDKQLRVVSPWRKNRTIRWEEIESYDLSGWWGWHILKTRTQGLVRLSFYLTGLQTFMEEFDRRSDALKAEISKWQTKR